MRDRLQRNVVNTWKPCRWPARQARQFPAITFGKVSLGSTNLLFNKIEIVEQPFPAWRDATVLRDRQGE